MWSGGLIKFVVRQSADKPCHQGAVSVILTEHNKKRVLTAGNDGYVRHPRQFYIHVWQTADSTLALKGV